MSGSTSQTETAAPDPAHAKDFKICDVLGGLDVTRLVSTNARNFFRSAIDDVELMREYLTEAARGDYPENPQQVGSNITNGMTLAKIYSFASLDAMSQTLDWEARGFPEGTNTVEAGIGWTDDRPDRRVDRYKGTTGLPIVGDHESDFRMMDALTPLLPWLVDRKSKESAWWRDHQNGISESVMKEPFLFESLYTAAWLVSWGEVVMYYPPMSVYGHPLTMGDVVGGEYYSREEPFITPNLPEDNPKRQATFTAPYPDTALEGVALITATAPVYYTGEFGGYTFNDTFVASLGIDMKVSAVSAFLDVLQDSLTPSSFGLLVDSDFNTIVISQEVVNRIYPERTGMEDARVVIDKVDGSVVQDRRNQTYMPSDTIVQDLTKLNNADWTSLKETINNAAPGERDFVLMDITLTKDTDPTSFYVMFETWEYVADWVLLVLVPKAEVDKAIDVYFTTEATATDEGRGGAVYMEGSMGQTLAGNSMLVNDGSLDVTLSLSALPGWIELESGIFTTTNTTEYVLGAGNSLSIPFQINTENLDPGTQSDSIVFEVQDDDYPDCFFREPLSIPISVRVLAKDCGDGLVADANGNCVCSSDSVSVGGGCIGVGALVSAIIVPVLVLVVFAGYIFAWRRRKAAEAIFEVDPELIDFGDPPTVVGKGSFGRVYLAEYHGTKVAVKTIRRQKKKPAIVMSMNEEQAMEEGNCAPERRAPTTQSVVSIPYTRESRTHFFDFLLGSNSRTSISATERQQRKAFIKEMHLLSKLRHPNITMLLGGITKDTDRPMLILEYMDRGSLWDILKSDVAIDGELIHSILKDITQGVRFLHNAKPMVIHGDLKSQNILIDSKFRAKVTDFGLTASTPYWMAPELLLEPDNKSTASDVYALGIVLYEIYARDTPYQGEDVYAVLRQVIDAKINKRPPVPATMKPSMAAMMHDCLLAQPQERPSLSELTSRINRLGPAEVEYRDDSKENGQASSNALANGAQKLGMSGKSQTYECVTLVICDIFNYASISEDLGPMKAADLQQRLYDQFDAHAAKCQIFMVENAPGAAWMGATNCHRDQESSHAKIAAQFAMTALELASKVLVDEEDPELGFVEIQVAIHTGPVEGNVTSITPPRSIFSGSAVNKVTILSAMAPAQGIICSETSEELLKQQAPKIRTAMKEKVVLEDIGPTTTFNIQTSIDRNKGAVIDLDA